MYNPEYKSQESEIVTSLDHYKYHRQTFAYYTLLTKVFFLTLTNI